MTLALVFLFFVSSSNAVRFDSCEHPVNNSQRIQWLNRLVVSVQGILSERNATSWISQGTLLGSVRENKTLFWTGDADVHMFYEDMAGICDRNSGLASAFKRRNLRVYDCKRDFVRVCFANASLLPAPRFAETGQFAPQSLLELYGCKRRSDGLYDIPNNRCVWNFTGLLPLKRYHLGDGVYARGPNKPIYWMEQYYGKNWRTPNYYAGNKDIDGICQGKI